MKIFVDFDDTLFHTKKFFDDLVRVFYAHGVTEAQFREAYDAIRPRDPRKQLTYLQEHFALDTEDLARAFDDFMRAARGYVFPDVDDFLSAFAREDLFLLSYATKEFQREKIARSGLEHFFRDVLITSGSKFDILSDVVREEGLVPHEAVVFIDDHPDQLGEMEQRDRDGITTLHIRRPEGRYSALSCDATCNYEVKNLVEAREIIEALK